MAACPANKHKDMAQLICESGQGFLSSAGKYQLLKLICVVQPGAS